MLSVAGALVCWCEDRPVVGGSHIKELQCVSPTGIDPKVFVCFETSVYSFGLITYPPSYLN